MADAEVYRKRKWLEPSRADEDGTAPMPFWSGEPTVDTPRFQLECPLARHAFSFMVTVVLRVYLFGQPRFDFNGLPLKFSVLPKTLPLCAYLLLQRAQPVARDTVAFTLWPDRPESGARANLRRHLHDLRRALPGGQSQPAWILSDADTVQWN